MTADPAASREELAQALAEAHAEIARLREAMASLSHRDPATGLPDRLRWADRTAQALSLAERQGGLVGILHIGLDRLKALRQVLGLQASDALAAAVATRLGTPLSPADTLARLGEEAFGVLLPGLREASDAVRVAQGLLSALEAPFQVEGREVALAGSVGVSLFPLDGVDAGTLHLHAEQAAARAQASGGGRIQCTTPTLSEASLERRELELYLGEAVAHGALEVVYQPQVRPDGSVLGAEALVRWQHPVLGAVPPGKFIPLAEANHLIHGLGSWVLETACRQMKAWQDRCGRPLRLAVNVSAHQVTHPRWLEGVAAILARVEFPAACLELELTESTLLAALHPGAAPIQALQRLGVRLGIDDFGTGYSSLTYLQRLPLDTLKVDQSFVAGLGQDGEDRSSDAIVRSIVALARSLELDLVAEGVETEAQRACLVAFGCDALQGYLLGAPMTPEAFEAWLDAGTAP